jgi:hypothetical protein
MSIVSVEGPYSAATGFFAEANRFIVKIPAGIENAADRKPSHSGRLKTGNINGKSVIPLIMEKGCRPFSMIPTLFLFLDTDGVHFFFQRIIL